MPYSLIFFFPLFLLADSGCFAALLLADETISCRSCFVTDFNSQVAQQLREIAINYPDENVRLLVRVQKPCLSQLLSRLKPLLGPQVSSLGDGHHLLVVANVKEVMHELAKTCVQSIYLDQMHGN